MRIFYSNGSDLDDDFCEVRLEEAGIVVSYIGNEGPEVHVGRQIGAEGHFLAKCKTTGCDSVFHMIPKSKFINGYWKEGGYEGMWRIELGKPFVKKQKEETSRVGSNG